MKWFGNFDSDGDMVDQYISYIAKTIERSERYTTVKHLLYHLRKGEVSESQKRKMVDTQQPRLMSRISLQADTNLIQYIIDSEPKAQNVIGSLLHNRNITNEQLRDLVELCDDSKRGVINYNIATKKLNDNQ
jgi:predicted transcriptional regulator